MRKSLTIHKKDLIASNDISEPERVRINRKRRFFLKALASLPAFYILSRYQPALANSFTGVGKWGRAIPVIGIYVTIISISLEVAKWLAGSKSPSELEDTDGLVIMGHGNTIYQGETINVIIIFEKNTCIDCGLCGVKLSGNENDPIDLEYCPVDALHLEQIP